MYVAQVVTGHGVFGKFLHRIGKAETSSCWYFSEIEDHSEHTLFECSRWDEARLDVGRKLGVTISCGNMGNLMTKDHGTL